MVCQICIIEKHKFGDSSRTFPRTWIGLMQYTELTSQTKNSMALAGAYGFPSWDDFIIAKNSGSECCYKYIP